MTPAPLIGIATDVSEPRPDRPRSECSLAYAQSVARAGGVPVLLVPLVDQIPAQLARLDGFVLTGGDDPRTEMFGEPTHPAARPVHPLRQAYEVALITALLERPEVPVLGICLGMQMMALVGGGKLDQHLPDQLATAAEHADNREHRIRPVAGGPLAGVERVEGVEGGGGGSGGVASSHRQAVRDPGRFRVVAHSPDGVIEAIDDPARRFCLGVQWHPERTADAALGAGVFARLIEAAAAYWAGRGGGGR